MTTRTALAATLLASLLAACDPPSPGPSTGSQGGGGDTGGGGGSGGSGGGGQAGGGGPSTLTLVLDRQGTREGVTSVTLEVVALALFVDAGARYADADTRCDGDGAGRLVDLQSSVALDLGSTGRTPLASLDRTDGSALNEIWLVLRQGMLDLGGRTYKVHAGALCVMPDGLQYALVRLRPPSPIPLADGTARDVVIGFDAGRQIEAERVDCSREDVEECRSSDDAGDDGDPGTRLRFTFAPEFPVAVEETAR